MAEKFWKRLNYVSSRGWRRDGEERCGAESADGYVCERKKGHTHGHCCDHASWKDGDGPRDPMTNQPKILDEQDIRH